MLTKITCRNDQHIKKEIKDTPKAFKDFKNKQKSV